MQTNIKFLLDYCSKYPEVYNEIASRLWVQFGIRSAELVLLCTYCVMEDRRKMNLSDDFINECAQLHVLCTQIVDMLPEDPADALTCISMIIDMWARKNNRSSRATWKGAYDVAMAVHDEMGDCK